MNHLISLKEQSTEDLLHIFDVAKKIKNDSMEGADLLKNKTLIMLFQKNSTRTRLSFETGMTELGGHGIFLDARSTQFSLSDLKDEIRAIMQFGDVLMFRAFKASDVALAASYNQIPVIDGCSEKYHPCQALADVLTMSEDAGGIDKIKKVAWLGVENNVSNTLKLACAKLGIKMAIASPEADLDSIDPELNQMSGASNLISYTKDPAEAVSGADYVHTDTWMNMEFFENGEIKPSYREEFERRKNIFNPYQLNAGLIDAHAPSAKIMHCMPCHAGYEISRDAIDHKNSIIFKQAANRKHAQKAILSWLLGGLL